MPPSGAFAFWEARMRENDLLTRDEVLALLKCARSTLYTLMETRRFPRPLKIATANRWLRIEVDAWLDRQAQQRRGQ